MNEILIEITGGSPITIDHGIAKRLKR